ncbi:MAG: hypothetical protein COW24_03520 [Candidatus Kerfeldbacteria bacterium CG15_BIG_FIL_POST_REV_8_21_14_020_45_12]|uniref:PEP-utilising enzyme mobile domain-containing protein n=1 Tax=Candidatus Kerfeldbacteria bacterium CG15_BIG_FIL_POST_REV_8_21_14_020_45_12 TaxID=2014247 RepID=A0A2M7H3K2_9BACT|nr:MAG: hypothetical protein COW24_03520 [Candidatus Kerfeldbacteria bacterium CG15_BIG_FIL_POST_REV_8_21_14_020_45_12]PJA93095.1 MAG: hypothetical protein CO132_04935 [Candidatus Kerfeldbacteria bacterium CG_4_9_14_3_um_filter_45_8]
MVKEAERVIVEISDKKTGLESSYTVWKKSVLMHDHFVAEMESGGKWKTKDDLLVDLNRFNDLMLEMWKIPFIIDCFDPIGDEVITREVFSHCDGLTDEEKGVLLRNQELTTHDLLELDILRGLQLEQKELDGLMQERWHWIQNDYAGGRILPVEHFRAEIDSVKHSFPNHVQRQQRIEALNGMTERVVKQKQEVMDRYGLSEPQQGIVYLFSFLTDWREERKRVNQMSFWVYQLFVDRLADFMQIEPELIKMADPREEIILGSDNPREILLQRRVTGVVYAEDTINNTTIISDDPNDVQLYKNTIAALMEEDRGETVTGNVAQPGVVEGIVKIINSQEDFEKFHDGNILVAAMTRPELMPVIRRAAGIITDEGGVTCHAAVISRELGIPCIIGTMNATAKLKDGDHVELNANSGEVRKIE